ncbi:MAG TPA: 23S rRNA (pseudouridine(1915)-N(3))-methyltransferase RlmH [Burkholderiales bacterium]
MKLFIVAVGNKAPAWVTGGFAEYAKRMPPEARVELIEVKPEPREAGRTPAQMMAAEAKRIFAAVPAGAKLVALDERGKDATTRDLAARISAWQQEGDDVAFVIGGADGLDPEVKARAALLLRLSSLTLPHALVRVILAEALYRAVSLNQGHPYHRE